MPLQWFKAGFQFQRGCISLAGTLQVGSLLRILAFQADGPSAETATGDLGLRA